MKGFTLIEALISGAMLVTILGLVAGITTQYARVNKATEFGERFRILMRATLDDVLTEAKDAFDITQPALAVTATELRFLRLNAATNTTRFPPLPEPPNPMPTDWEPFANASRNSIRYYRAGERLLRASDQGGLGSSENLIFDLCAGFSATRLPNNLLEVRLSTEKDGRVETRTGRVHCPCL